MHGEPGESPEESPGNRNVREGSVADVSIFKLENLPIQMRDVFGDHLDLDRVLITKATIADGRVVFAQLNYSPYIEEYR